MLWCLGDRLMDFFCRKLWKKWADLACVSLGRTHVSDDVLTSATPEAADQTLTKMDQMLRCGVMIFPKSGVTKSTRIWWFGNQAMVLLIGVFKCLQCGSQGQVDDSTQLQQKFRLYSVQEPRYPRYPKSQHGLFKTHCQASTSMPFARPLVQTWHFFRGS